MGMPGPKKVHRYTNEFKVQAVRLSLSPDFQTQDVAHALDIHPFMLSRWRKEAREGRLRGKHRKVVLNTRLAGELRELYELKQRYVLLKEEHELLKKAVRFCSQAKRRSLPSLKLRARASR
jgi:transposase